jgi:hypothetical protein
MRLTAVPTVLGALVAAAASLASCAPRPNAANAEPTPAAAPLPSPGDGLLAGRLAALPKGDGAPESLPLSEAGPGERVPATRLFEQFPELRQLLGPLAAGTIARRELRFSSGLRVGLWSLASRDESGARELLSARWPGLDGARRLALELDVLPWPGPALERRSAEDAPPGEPGIAFLYLGDAPRDLADVFIDAVSGDGLRFRALPGAALVTPPGEARSAARGPRLAADLDGARETPLCLVESIRAPAAAAAVGPFEPLRPAAIHPGGILLAPDSSGEALDLSAADWPPDAQAFRRLLRRLERVALPPELAMVEIGPGWHRGELDPGGWEPAESRFPDRIAPLAREAAARGCLVSLWLDPFGARRGEPGEWAAQEGTILRDAGGDPVREAPWRWLFDPTAPAGQAAIRTLVERTLAAEGPIDLLRLGGAAGARAAYRRHWQRLAAARGRGAIGGDVAADAALREAVRAVRAGARGRPIAVDAASPPAAAGLVDFHRPALEPMEGGDPLVLDGLAAARGLAGLGWLYRLDAPPLRWRDPLLSDGPLPSPAFEALVSLRALTGRSFQFAGVDVEALGVARGLIARALPPLPIAALTLGDPDLDAGALPSVWDLKVRLGDGRRWDVVGLFNWDAVEPRLLKVSLSRLRAPGGGGGRVLVFDRWEERFLAAVDDGFEILVPPRSARVLSLHEIGDAPIVAGTASHLSGVERALRSAVWDRAAGELAVELLPERREPLAVHVWVPADWELRQRQAEGGRLAADLDGGHLKLILDPDGATPLRARLRFGRRDPRRGPARAGLSPLRATPESSGGGALLEWEPIASGDADLLRGYELRVGGRLLGSTIGRRFAVPRSELPASGALRVEVLARGAEGEALSEPAALEISPPPPREIYLSEMAFAGGTAPEHRLPPGRDLGPSGLPLRVAGRRYARGFGVRVPSSLAFDLGGRYRFLTAEAGVDFSADLGTQAVFHVLVDDREAFASPALRYGEAPLELGVALAGARRLELRVEAPAGQPPAGGRPFASWGDARLLVEAVEAK